MVFEHLQRILNDEELEAFGFIQPASPKEEDIPLADDPSYDFSEVPTVEIEGPNP
ncbi:MAG: hypothetical protein OSB21_05450 [Myxococcota bacterium]|nr:hypothetical protein [Myxococcota bacterium]